MARKRVTYRYLVTGEGEFPIDMMRYDRATPAREADSDLIRRTFQPYRSFPVTLVMVSERPPTEGRWRSFGWRIVQVEEVAA